MVLKLFIFKIKRENTIRFLKISKKKEIYTYAVALTIMELKVSTRHGNVGDVIIPQDEDILKMLNWTKNINL